MSRFLLAFALFAAAGVIADAARPIGADPDCPQKVAAAKKALDDALASQKAADDALTTEKASLDAAVALANLNVQKANSAYLTAENTYNTDMFSYNTALQGEATAKAHLADVENACSQTPPPTDCAQQIQDAVNAEAAAKKKLDAANSTVIADKKAVDDAKTDLDGARQAYDAAVAHEQSELARLNGNIQKANTAVLEAQQAYAEILNECPQSKMLTARGDIDCNTAVPAARKALNDSLAAQKAADDALTTEKPSLDAQVAKANDDQQKANNEVLTAQNKYNSDMFVYNTDLQKLQNAEAALADVENACSQTPQPYRDCGARITSAVRAVDAANTTYTAEKKVVEADKEAVDTAVTNRDGAQAAYKAAVDHEQSELTRLNNAIQSANLAVLQAQQNLAEVLQECPQTTMR